jgi:ankyrin repeat protein
MKSMMIRIIVPAALAAISLACESRIVSSPLGAAAAGNRTDEVRQRLASGEQPDQLGPDGTTPLIDAARTNALAAMEVLLDAGADPNRPDARSRGWTALMHAVNTRHADAVRLLLNRGADPNIPSVLIPRDAAPEHPHGGLPLLMAATDSDPTFVSLLLAHGARPRADGHDGAVVLTAAVSGQLFDETDAPPVVLALTGLQIATSRGCHRENVQALLAHDPGLRLGRAYGGTQQARTVGRWTCSDLLALVDR